MFQPMFLQHPRCVLKTGVQREVWGDGGRLVLLEEVGDAVSR